MKARDRVREEGGVDNGVGEIFNFVFNSGGPHDINYQVLVFCIRI